MSRLPGAKSAQVGNPSAFWGNAVSRPSSEPTGPLACGRCAVRLGIFWTLRDGARIDTRQWHRMPVGFAMIEVCHPCYMEAVLGVKQRTQKMHNKPRVDQLALPGLERDAGEEQKPRTKRRQRMGA